MADLRRIGHADRNDLLRRVGDVLLEIGRAVGGIGMRDGDGIDVLEHCIKIDAAAAIMDDDRNAGITQASATDLKISASNFTEVSFLRMLAEE